MNPMVLGFAGYSLLLSSCVALIFLLRISCGKDILKSPLHVLSTSDTVISIITSLILLVNQSLSPTNFGHVSMNKTAGGRLLEDREAGEYGQTQTCVRFFLNHSDSRKDSQGLGRLGTNCTFQHVLMQYAMFLVPFANAFMSLLIYSVQCSSGISCVAKKCSKLTEAIRNTSHGLDSNIRRRDSDAEKDKNTRKTVLTVANDQTIPTKPNNSPKFTSFGLMVQWLVPVVVTAVLSLSKPQDMEKLHESMEMECIFRVNFPLDSCDTTDFGSLINRSEYYNVGLTDKIQVNDPDTSRISYPNSEVIDEIISKVRSVIKLAMNKTCDNSTEFKNSSSFRPWNITQYITTGDPTRRNLSSNDDEMLERLTKIQEALDSNDLGALNHDCTTEADDPDKADQEVSEDEELKLFEEVVKNAENDAITESLTQIFETTQQDALFQEITTAAVTEDIRDDQSYEIPEEKQSEREQTDTIKADNITTEELNEKIYEDMIKRIRDTVTQVKAKGQTGNFGDSYGTSNGNSKDSEQQIPSLGSGAESSKVRKSRERGDESEAQLNTYEGCFLSAKFLKIHLSFLLFIIYFVPVSISGILQTRAVYVCKNIYQQIKSANKKNTKISERPESEADENRASELGWFPSKPNDATNTVAAPTRDFEKIEEANLSDNEESDGFKNVLEETKGIQMLFNVLTKSLMLSILMWTPAFLEILSKVFLCSSTPAWLVNVLYLLGVSFGVVKNIVNVSIAKINKAMRDEGYRKENSVYPSA